MLNFNKLVLTYLFSSLSFLTVAQSWQRTYGGISDDFGNDFQQTSDSGYIITGSTYNINTHGDIYLIRTNINGDTLWTKTYGGIYTDDGISVKQTADGGFIVGGETTSFSGGVQEIYLVRTNANGDTLWTKRYGNGKTQFCASLIISADNGFCIVGSTGDVSNGQTDAYLIKTDANGVTTWTRSIGKSSDDFGYSLQQTKDGGYVISGGSYNTATSLYEEYLIKTDANGDTLWTKTFAGSGHSYGNAVIQTFDDGYVVAGYTNGDYYIVKTDSLGVQQWAKIIDEGGDDRAFSVIESDGGYVMAGYSYVFGGADGLLQKVDANGNPVWTKRFGGPDWDQFNGIRVDVTGGFIMAGTTQSYGAGGNDVWLVKTDCINYPMDSIFTSDPTFFCQGVDTVSTTMRSPMSSGLEYQWQRNDVDIPGATSGIYTADSAGTYRLIVSDIAGCSNSSSDSIMVNVSFVPSKPIITQAGNTLQVSALFGSYQWYLNDTLIPGATGFNYVIARSGRYTVVYSLGCSSTSEVFNAVFSGIENIDGKVSVNISPNPLSTSASLSVVNQSGLTLQNLKLSLFDELGRSVLQADVKNNAYLIEHNNLAAGVYFYQLKQPQGILANGKIVVQ